MLPPTHCTHSGTTCEVRRTGHHPLHVTADRTAILDGDAAAAGVTAVLAKPFALEALLERLEGVLTAST
jgi:CheY-like chemotaxis protein